MWIARDSNGQLGLYTHQPQKHEIKFDGDDKKFIYWRSASQEDRIPIPKNQFDYLQPEDEPIEVTICKEDGRHQIYQQALQQYGTDHQKDMVIEECSELINALTKERRKRTANVVTEIADVQIMLNQMKILYGEELIEAEIDRKLKRLTDRMKANNNTNEH